MTQSWRLHGFGDGQHFHARLPGLAVDDGLVGLEEGAGMVFVGEFDARGEEAAPFLRGKLPVVRVVFPGAPLTGKLLQVEITAQRPPFSADSARPALLSATFGAFLVTEVLDIMEQIPGIALAAQTAAAQDVSPVGVDVIHDEAGVGDDQAGFFPVLAAALLLEQVGDDLAHHLEVLQVHARFRFVQEHHLGILGQQLQEFGALELTPGKAVIDLPVQKLGEIVGRGQDLGGDGAPGADPQDVRGLDAPDRGRALEGQAQAQAGPFIRWAGG